MFPELNGMFSVLERICGYRSIFDPFILSLITGKLCKRLLHKKELFDIPVTLNEQLDKDVIEK